MNDSILLCMLFKVDQLIVAYGINRKNLNDRLHVWTHERIET